MYEIKELREQRKDLLAEQREIFNKAQDAGRNLTIEESRRFDKIEKQFREIDGTLRAHQAIVEDLGQRAATGAKSTVLGDIAHGLVTGRSENFHSRSIDLTSGAATVQDPVVMDEIITTLIPQNRLAGLGARIENITPYSQWAVVTAPPAVTWFAEGGTLSADTALTISSKKVELKTAVALVKVSKLLLQDSSDRARQLVNTEIINQLNAEMNRVALSGAAGSNEPVGLDNVAGLQTVDAASAVLTDYSSHVAAVSKLLSVNVPIGNIGYIQGITSWAQEAAFADSTGQPLMIPPSIAGTRNFATSAVLENYGGTTDETRIYVGDFSQMVIGLGGTFSMELVERYADTMHTAFLVYVRMDSTVLRPNNFVRIQNIATA
jgi:HK97 family phage major capsid protein